MRVPSPPLLRSFLTGVTRTALGLVYPPLCLHCDARLPAEPEAAPLALCPRCARRLTPYSAEALAAFLAGTPLTAVAVLWRNDSEGPFQSLHHAMKYKNRPSLARAAGRVLGRAGAPAGPLVPVPSTRARRLERGYNQAALIAEGLSEVTGQPVRAEWLTRTGHAGSQARLGRRRRSRNVEGAFEVPDGLSLDGQPVVLVDDVVTSGSTVRAAVAALTDAGAEVSLAVLAATR